MFSRLLIKLIDQAIVPAILILVTRVVSVVLIANYFGIPFAIENTGFVYNSVTDFVLVNSYSILSLVFVVTFGLLYILVKSYYFHDSHITPQLTAKLFMVRLSSFIQSSFDLYSQGSVWLSYSYLLLIVSGAMTFFGMVYSWVFFTSLVFTVVSTVLLIIDIEKELTLSNSVSSDESVEELEEVILTLR